jgi:hypothetical protein
MEQTEHIGSFSERDFWGISHQEKFSQDQVFNKHISAELPHHNYLIINHHCPLCFYRGQGGGGGTLHHYKNKNEISL